MTTSAENGFSLMEVLVSIFVLAVGVVGAVGMQLTALRTSQHSALQTKALHLAVEMADAMSAHSAATQSNPYLGIDYPASVTHVGEPAGFDIQYFLHRVARDFPDARLRICRDAQPWDSARRQYRWDCMHAPNAAIAIKIAWAGKEADAVAPAPVVVLMLALGST